MFVILYYCSVSFVAKSRPKLEIIIQIISFLACSHFLRALPEKKSSTSKIFKFFKFSMNALISKAENYISNFFLMIYICVFFYIFVHIINYIKTLFWAKINHPPNKFTFIHESNKNDSLKVQTFQQQHEKFNLESFMEKKLIELCQFLFFIFALITNLDTVAAGQRMLLKTKKNYIHIFLAE